MGGNITSILHSDNYRMLVDSIDEGVNIIEKVDAEQNERINFRYILINPAFERITGLTDVIGKTVIDVLPGVNDSTMQVYDDILKTGQPVRFETYEPALERWFSAYAFPIDEPELKRIAVIFNDITDIKNSEITLQESEKKYRDLYDSIDEGFCIIEVLFDDNDQPLDYRFLGVNPAFERQTGLVGAEGRCMRDIAPANEQHWFDIYGRVALTGEPVRFQNTAEALGRFYDVYAFRVGKPEQRKVAILFNDITARKQAEEALRESEKKYRTIIETAGEGIIYANPDGPYLYCNQRFADMLGYSKDELLGKASTDFSFVDEQTQIRQIRGILNNGSVLHGEFRFRRKDGSELWTIFNATPVFNVTGEHIANFVMYTDITERKRMEEELRRSRSQLEAELIDVKLLQSISLELLSEDNIQVLYERLIDTAAFIMRSDYASMQLLHTEYGESDRLQLIACRGFNSVAAKFWRWIEADSCSIYGRAFRTGERVIVPDVEKCGFIKGTKHLTMFLETGVHAVQATPLWSRSGKMVGVISTHWREPHMPSERELSLLDVLARQAADLIERKRLEEELRYQKGLFESVIENMNDALVIYNKEGRIEFMNAESRKMYPNLSNHMMVNDIYSDFEYYDLENKLKKVEDLPTQRVLKGEKIRNEKILIKRPDKDQYTEINATPIFDNQGSLAAAVVTHRDISEIVIHQQALIAQQEQLLKVEKEKRETLEEAIKLKDEFLYLITHEFKTPITVISSAIQSVDSSMKAEVPERLRRYLNMIKMNTNRQLRLVNNLLDITKMSSGNIKLNMGKFDIVYVTKAILKSVELYALQKNITLNFTSRIARKEIFFDEEKYERIILNILSNALKFTPKGKSINVILSTKKLNNQNFVSISVNDEGIGIPFDRQKIIFERFGQADTNMSRQAEGTGLGLHLVKLLVDSLGGKISLKSKVSFGSTFTILLPAKNHLDLFESTACKEHRGHIHDMNSRIIQATNIEFSDIYFD